MAPPTNENKSETERNGAISPVSQYSTASEGENQEGNNAPINRTTTQMAQIDENAPITSLTAGKMMELFAASLNTEQAQNAIQTSFSKLIDPVKTQLDENGRDLASLKARVETLEVQQKNPGPSPHSVKINEKGVVAIDWTRRNNLVFTGVKGTPDECKKELNKIFKKLSLKVGAYNTFRRGPNATNVIAEFAGHWDKILIYKNRTKLMDKGISNVFINEDLNEAQDRVFYTARSAKKQNLIHSAWTTEGITHISKIVKGTVMTRAVYSEEEVKQLIPRLKIEPRTKLPRQTKSKL